MNKCRFLEDEPLQEIEVLKTVLCSNVEENLTFQNLIESAIVLDFGKEFEVFDLFEGLCVDSEELNNEC